MRLRAWMILFVLGPSLAISASAAASCDDQGGAVSYDYCLFDSDGSQNGNWWNSTTTLGWATVGAATAGTGTTLDVLVIEDQESAGPRETAESDTTGAALDGQAAYRTTYEVSATQAQSRQNGQDASTQATSTSVRAVAQDPLVRTWGVEVTHAQSDATGPCRESATLRVYFIADSLTVGPNGGCQMEMPWIDSGRVSTTVVSTLP